MASKERPQTPISISATSSSSEEESVTAVPYSSYPKEEVPAVAERRLSQNLPKIDPTVIHDLEDQARLAAGSLTRMTKYLMVRLAEMSEVTVQTSHVYAEAVQNASCSAEENIRLTYALMAKCEELNQKMKPVYEIQHQVEDIKQQLDILESAFK